MIRLALPVFSSAVGLFFAGMILSAEEEKPERFDTVLDTEGVRVVELRAKDGVEVSFCAKGKPRVTADNDGGTRIAANRSGDRLVVIARIEYYDRIEVCLPPTVRELRVSRATVATGEGVTVDALRIVASHGLSWTGRAGELHLEAPARPPTCREGCRNDVEVAGSIDALSLVVAAGDARIERPETMGRVTVALGKSSTLGLGGTRDPGRVRITDLAGVPLPADGPRLPVIEEDAPAEAPGAR